MTLRLIGLIFLFFASNAKAQTYLFGGKQGGGLFEDVLTVGAYYIGYADVRNDLSSDVAGSSVDRVAEYGAEIGIRTFKIFAFNMVGQQSVDGRQKSFGLGVKAYLPGVFMLGGQVRDLVYGQKKTRIRTYGASLIETVQVTAPGGTTSFVSSSFKLGMELRLFNGFHITGFATLTNFVGNYVLGSGCGVIYLF